MAVWIPGLPGLAIRIPVARARRPAATAAFASSRWLPSAVSEPLPSSRRRHSCSRAERSSCSTGRGNDSAGPGRDSPRSGSTVRIFGATAVVAGGPSGRLGLSVWVAGDPAGGCAGLGHAVAADFAGRVGRDCRRGRANRRRVGLPSRSAGPQFAADMPCHSIYGLRRPVLGSAGADVPAGLSRAVARSHRPRVGPRHDRGISVGMPPCRRPRFCSGSIRWRGGSVPCTGPRAMRCATPFRHPIWATCQAYCRTLAQVALEGAASFPALGLAMARTCDVRRRIAVLQRRVFAAALGRRAVGCRGAGRDCFACIAGGRAVCPGGTAGPDD